MIRNDKPLWIQIIFYAKYPLVLFMLFWIFLVRCSLRSTVIFLIVSKEIQKYDQRKFAFFQKRNIFKFGIHVHRWKKNCKKNLQFFFRTLKLQNKKFAISKISNKKLRKIHYFVNIKYNKNILVKRKIFAKKKFEKKMFPKKKM